jgi:hypothetical protein
VIESSVQPLFPAVTVHRDGPRRITMYTTRTFLLTASLVSAACTDASEATPGTSDDDTVTITARDTRSLAPGATLELELDGVTTYTFDPSLGPIAFERIVLLGTDGYNPSDVIIRGMADRSGLSFEAFTAAAVSLTNVPDVPSDVDERRWGVCQEIFCGPGGGGVDLDCNSFPMLCFCPVNSPCG